MAKFTRHTLAFVVALSLGLHWAALQSVAWVSMLVDYSTEGSFSEAIVKTFDGKNPCDICIAVSEGRKADQEQECASWKGFKVDWIPSSATSPHVWSPTVRVPIGEAMFATSYMAPPPAPPPQTV